ncbi:TetR/AcrR family transcriptional regulator [Aquibacillus rhizosphaerae]|uniref:TetR/AcrR family transcriptional regulator n=1 Tax=Aquibacillus rhizosphaerae TaxID=3051431 RepID=A0ABT7L5V1_9BACI|nr:TetR/AcrR family transcriptional regulator [Aquibacillus sp. LR5S19]MDL4841241.1 TetR/AcrR family transcriptional regulator [Aquibacillus sp. LR5S19]
MKKLSSRALKKKEQIQLAAQRLFLEKGFSNTSMDAITKEAGVSKQTVYSYYESKEDLLFDVFQSLIGEIDIENKFQLTQNIEINNIGDLTMTLEMVAEKISKNLVQPEYLGMARIILAEMAYFPQLGELFKEAVPTQIIGTISNILSHANKIGVIKINEADMDVVARMLIGPLLTYILLDGLLVPKDQVTVPSREKIASIIHYFIKSIQ